MADDLSFIRKWIKRGLSKDGKTLDFSNRGINNDIAMDLAENVSLPDIEILYLHTNKIKDLGLEELAQAEIFAPLRELWLYENVIRDEGAVAPKLRYLSLYTNRISDEGAVALAESDTLSNLETLDLSFNRIGDRGACALANTGKLKKLKTLHLDANRIGFEGMSALASSQGLPALVELNMQYNLMDPQGLELLHESTKLNSKRALKYDGPRED